MLALEITYSAASYRFICMKNGRVVRRIDRDQSQSHDQQVEQIAKELMAKWENIAIGKTRKGWVVVPVI